MWLEIAASWLCVSSIESLATGTNERVAPVFATGDHEASSGRIAPFLAAASESKLVVNAIFRALNHPPPASCPDWPPINVSHHKPKNKSW
jgi:hypothetical protein